MVQNELIPHLFRTEYSKIVAVLCKTYGLASMEQAEDFVSESFLKAAETWKLKGIPEQPTAWLYTVAKNNAKDYFRRAQHYKSKIETEFLKEGEPPKTLEIDLSENNIQDSQLQMLFAVCNSVYANEAQIALALKILCGFGIEEIAQAFLTTKQTINKRLYRAKEKLREQKVKLTFSVDQLTDERMDNVLTILYLLFNEGYYSATDAQTIRKEFCYEAMRLLHILTEHPLTRQPKVFALMALFCFHSSRFNARINHSGEQILYEHQDAEQWDMELIDMGQFYLNLSADGEQLTKYHLEGMIAFWHTQKQVETTQKWHQILQLYNRLLQVEYSPVTALNRTYALAMAEGKQVAIKEALKIDLKDHHLYHSLLAHFYHDLDSEKEKYHLEIALSLTHSPTDKRLLKAKLREFNA